MTGHNRARQGTKTAHALREALERVARLEAEVDALERVVELLRTSTRESIELNQRLVEEDCKRRGVDPYADDDEDDEAEDETPSARSPRPRVGVPGNGLG